MKEDRSNDSIGLRLPSELRNRFQLFADAHNESLSSVVKSLATYGLDFCTLPIEEKKLIHRIKEEVKGKTNVTDGKFAEILRDVGSWDDKIERVWKLDDEKLASYVHMFCLAAYDRPAFKEIHELSSIPYFLRKIKNSGELDEKQAQNEDKFTFGALDELYEEVKKDTIQKAEEVITEDNLENVDDTSIETPSFLVQFRKENN